jgi:hypothetical protein
MRRRLLREFFAQISTWWRRPSDAPRPPAPALREVLFKANFEEDLPDEFSENTLHVAGEQGNYWCAAMSCPCGCGALIHLSLVAADDPSWKLRFDRSGRPSLTPSVWRTSGCKSHFFLRAGRIEWYSDARTLNTTTK